MIPVIISKQFNNVVLFPLIVLAIYWLPKSEAKKLIS